MDSTMRRGVSLSPNASLISYKVVSLDLSDSTLENIEINFFRNCSNLISLDLSLVRFMNYSEGAFNDLVNLKRLQIAPKMHQIEIDTKSAIESLYSKQIVTLDKGLVSINVYRDSRFFPWNGHKSALQLFMNFFSQFPTSLETLVTNVLDDDRFALAFVRFQNLSTLQLGGEIQRITNTTFKPLLELPIKILKIEVVNLEQIELCAFEWNLRVLNMDKTVLSGINVMDILYPVFIGLYNSRLETLSLKYLVDRRNPLKLVNLTRIPGNYHVAKAFIYLTQLHFEGNEPCWLWFHVLFCNDAKSLDTIPGEESVKSIKISSLGSAIETLEHLQYLDVSYQQLASMELNDTSQLEGSSYYVRFSASANLEVLDLSGLCGYSTLTYCICLILKVTPNLKHVIFKDTYLSINIVAPNADLSVNVYLSTEGIDVDRSSLLKLFAINIDIGYNQLPSIMSFGSRSYLRYLSCYVKLKRLTEKPLFYTSWIPTVTAI